MSNHTSIHTEQFRDMLRTESLNLHACRTEEQVYFTVIGPRDNRTVTFDGPLHLTFQSIKFASTVNPRQDLQDHIKKELQDGMAYKLIIVDFTKEKNRLTEELSSFLQGEASQEKTERLLNTIKTTLHRRNYAWHHQTTHEITTSLSRNIQISISTPPRR